MTMRVSEMQSILATIVDIQQQKQVSVPVKFSYMLAKNARLLRAELTDVETAVNAGIDLSLLQRYEQKRLALLAAKARKNADGSPIIVGNEFQFRGDAQKVVAEITKTLEEQFPEAHAALTTRVERANELAEKEVDITLARLSLDNWPDMEAGQMDRLFALVAD